MKFTLNSIANLLAGLALLSASCAWAAPQQTASIGAIKLVGGQLKDCQVGYRTFGTLEADKSNVVLFPTWLTGKTADMEFLIGPGKLIDSSKWFVVLVDALGDGVSCSPSTSASNPKMKFPKFSIADMVESQHQLLTGSLDIKHVHAVVGMSMGGMQALQWSVSYPDFADRIVAIVATPQPTSQDLLTWSAEMRSIDGSAGWKGGNYSKGTHFDALVAVHTLSLWTPAYRAKTTPRADYEKYMAGEQLTLSKAFNVVDWYRQLQALSSFNLIGSGDMASLARSIKTPLMIVTSTQDHMVNPGPATELAGLTHAKLLALNNDCGHIAPVCEMDSVGKSIAEFLQ